MQITDILLAALAGGVICAAVQIFIDKTALTPARVLTALVVTGVVLYGAGVYEYLFSIFGCGVSVPLIGFGATIAKGVKEAIDTTGLLGILSGGLTATSAGITAALVLGLICSAVGKGHVRRMGRRGWKVEN